MAAHRMPSVRGVVAASEMRPATAAGAGWDLDYLAGQIVEVSGWAGSASLTMVASLILETQRRGEPVVWVTAQASIFFPPDLAAMGVDLDALPVVRLGKVADVARAADTLLRSASFALVVLDLGAQQSMSLAAQTRLSGLARKHRAVLIGVTRKERRRQSLGSLVSLRGDCSRQRTDLETFTCEFDVLKDKRGVAGWRHVELCRGPDGLC